jgi:phosphoglycerate dehydrogenase-like enzyme|tara:strand:- start:9955 stop:11010 length:1056 start_codon:yes stop_codon:yes gene_type:complete
MAIRSRTTNNKGDVMQNLLLPDSTFQRLKYRLSDFTDDVHAVRMCADGSLMVGDDTVTADQYPIHLAWLSIDLFRENIAAKFIECLSQAPQLEWMQTISAGLDSPFFKQSIERGVRLCNSDAQAPPIAEYVVASVLYRYQNFERRMEFQRSHHWNSTDFREIYASNWLIVGFGNIGSRVGRMVRGFEGDVTGVKRSPTSHADADRIITFGDLLDAVPAADVVVLACAVTEDTSGLVDQSFLDAMKSGAILVNIARGRVVDESALLQALDGDRLDCAILDVFQREPLPSDSKLWDHPKVLLTPHASSRGKGTADRWVELFLRNLTAYLSDEPLHCEVELSFFSSLGSSLGSE